MKLRRYLRNILYSFPLQLVILHLKKHHLLLIIWLFLFGVVTQSYGTHYGIPYLFLDPEYLGKVNFFSFLIVGLSIGGFIMAWHICFYLLNSYRFHFLATLTRPFTMFSFNNSMIPGIFLLVYAYKIYSFQSSQHFIYNDIFTNILGLFAGVIIMITLTTLYFILLNKNVNKFLDSLTEKAKDKLTKRNIHLNILQERNTNADQWPVETYLSSLFRLKLVRNVDHYHPELVLKVMRQHHKNAFVVIIASLVSLLAFGLLMDNPYFRIPAAAGAALMFSVIMVFAAAFTYWFGEWRVFVLVGVIIFINFISRFDLFVYKNKLMGLDYKKEPIPYNQETLDAFVTRSNIQLDINQTKKIMDRWKANVTKKYGETNPRIIFINTGGGGCKSAYWTMVVLQNVEKALGGKLLDHAILISGASGGMFGASYYREIYYREKKGEAIDLYEPAYAEDMAKDLLNPMLSAVVTNDIFFPWRKDKYNGQVYRKDRGYVFERQFNENSNFLLDKKVMDYEAAEKNAEIPLLILSPTIVNDQRSLYISAQKVSYLTRPYIVKSNGFLDYLSPDGVEFMPYFEDYGSKNLGFVSALRMQATFPYLFPTVYLPSSPQMKIMDAGLRENYGLGTSSRFYNVFRDWIDENTSGAIFLQIRTDPKFVNLKEQDETSLISEMLNPIGNIYSNFMYEQEYINDNSICMLENMSKTDINFINFAYRPAREEEVAAMSLHLTRKEKDDIKNSFEHPDNREALRRLKNLLY